MSTSTSLPADASIVDSDNEYVVDEREYLADRDDRSGLPAIPAGVPHEGDSIDVAAIEREFDSRAMRRPTAAAQREQAETQRPLSSVATSLPAEEDDEVSATHSATLLVFNFLFTC
jgi:hypothetical protein